MSKPWDERWEVDRLHRATIVMRDRERPPFYLSRVGYFEDSRHDVPLERDEACAKLAAAAPAMARLLCRLEWSQTRVDLVPHTCPACWMAGNHHAKCELDAALTAAGLDAEERERVRGA